MAKCLLFRRPRKCEAKEIPPWHQLNSLKGVGLVSVHLILTCIVILTAFLPFRLFKSCPRCSLPYTTHTEPSLSLVTPAGSKIFDSLTASFLVIELIFLGITQTWGFYTVHLIQQLVLGSLMLTVSHRPCHGGSHWAVSGRV